MKSDREILNKLRRFKEAKIEIKKYLSWIEQVKVNNQILDLSQKWFCQHNKINKQIIMDYKFKVQIINLNTVIIQQLIL